MFVKASKRSGYKKSRNKQRHFFEVVVVKLILSKLLERSDNSFVAKWGHKASNKNRILIAAKLNLCRMFWVFIQRFLYTSASIQQVKRLLYVEGKYFISIQFFCYYSNSVQGSDVTICIFLRRWNLRLYTLLRLLYFLIFILSSFNRRAVLD